MSRKKILLVTGSMNQTTQMHQIASFLSDYDCYFTQFYSTYKFINKLKLKGFFDNTILAGKFREDSQKYLRENGLKFDYRAKKHKYDLAIVCTDMYIPDNLKHTPKIWVQEGMIDDMTVWSRIVNMLKLPGYWALNTSLNGSSDQCDVFCTASEGYSKRFSSLGTNPNKIVVTGMPNYDNVEKFLENDFPYKGHVMVATSDIRELHGLENRPAFLQKCTEIAAGRRLIFKLHPNELEERAKQEIKENCPADTLVYTTGNINHMIANCEELITQFSSVVYLGLALHKKCHSNFDINELKTLTPVQNGGASAENIASIASYLLENKTYTNKDLRNLCKTYKKPVKTAGKVVELV